MGRLSVVRSFQFITAQYFNHIKIRIIITNIGTMNGHIVNIQNVIHSNNMYNTYNPILIKIWLFLQIITKLIQANEPYES